MRNKHAGASYQLELHLRALMFGASGVLCAFSVHEGQVKACDLRTSLLHIAVVHYQQVRTLIPSSPLLVC